MILSDVINQLRTARLEAIRLEKAIKRAKKSEKFYLGMRLTDLLDKIWNVEERGLSQFRTNDLAAYLAKEIADNAQFISRQRPGKSPTCETEKRTSTTSRAVDVSHSANGKIRTDRLK